ncbi:MAG TPA: hypothetical protein DCL77_20180 [Prolixibacteraceae bacterium]|jgi:uncharacterized surface protein with fasciclin (FAS1) repeats|nr:hypothetical protein [Prolixibacteraceae bacterium]
MTKNKQLTLISLLVLLLFGCKKENDKFTRPEWLPGKLFTQIQTKPELSTFATLVQKAGYDSIINVSGSYTVFAPSNEAFAQYFQENPNYKSVAEMPRNEAIKLVKYHIVQDPWSKKQLMTLDVKGWIDTLDLNNNEPKGYKRQTLYLAKNQKFGVEWSKYERSNSTTGLKRVNIVDSTKTSWTRRVFTNSRKYAPIFFKQYFDIYDLSASTDYAFYFGRQFESLNDLYYCSGRIMSDELFAENGFVYVIDRVVEPLRNGIEVLSDKSKGNSYTTYYNLVNLFSEFTYNEKETNAQPGAAQGLKVDSLFDLNYPQLVFDVNSEKTKAPRGTYGLPANVTIRYHHGIVAPTDGAMNQLVSQYLAGGNNWGSLENAPENIKRIVANSCLSINPIYPTDLAKGFLNGEYDYVKVDESSIVQKEYGSNCTFIGVNQPIVPRAFSSVTGPVYTRKGYSKVMYAIEKSGLLSALKRKDADYSFYVESDASTAQDSSLIYDSFFKRFTVATMWPAVKAYPVSVDDLRILLLNHIGVGQPKGIARKEFIKNLAGNYITVNNITKEVSGTASSTFGYQGFKQVTVIPTKISTNSDNGTTYDISNWLNFSTPDIFTIILTRYPKFHALIRKAGLTQDNLSKYTFMTENLNYTVFAPSDSILNLTNTSDMSPKELQNFVLLHFIQGDLIFTDGNKSTGYYETCRIDENSSPNTPVYTKIKIVPGIDQITIPAKDGSPALVVNESSKTNLLTGRSLSSTGQERWPNCVNSGVVHECKKVLLFGEVDTRQ